MTNKLYQFIHIGNSLAGGIKMSEKKNRINKQETQSSVYTTEDNKDSIGFLPKKPADFKDNEIKSDKEAIEDMKRAKERISHIKPGIQPLSQQEKEHLTYLRTLNMFNELKQTRQKYRKYSLLFIVASGIVFLLLMFSLDSKIEFLILWIISVVLCVFAMVRADYNYSIFKELVGIADEQDYYDLDEEDEETEPPQNDDAGITYVQYEKGGTQE